MSSPNATLAQQHAAAKRYRRPETVPVHELSPHDSLLAEAVEACLDEHLAPALLAQIASLTLHVRAQSERRAAD